MSPDPRSDELARQGAELLRAGHDAEALAVYRELARREPGHRAHWINLGTLLRQAGRLDDALAAYIEAAARGEQSAGFLYNVGLLHEDRGDYDSARRVLADALAAAPDDVEIRLGFARCCYESLRVDAATTALATWRELPGLTSEQLAAIALLLLSLGEATEAAAAAARLALDPAPSPAALLKLAQFHERTNRLVEAGTAAARLAALPGADVPGDEVALLEAQLALRAGRHAEAAAAFATLARACPEPHRRHLYLFPLAKALDAAGRRDEAWGALEEAHGSQVLQLARTNPETAGMREAPLVITRHGCDPADVASWTDPEAPPASASPVFVVAFPRSGTTLLEQMLDAHPALASMDEQPFLQQAIDRIGDRGVDYPAKLGALSPAEVADIRAHYLALAARRADLGPGRRLVDKNPLNLLRLPAIRRLFPHARIILAVRDPRDVLLSCFLQHFRAPEFAMLCRDLPALARAYDRAFRYWYDQAALLTPAVLEVRYESLVADFAGESARLMDFLGLDLATAQLDPAAHALARGYISTPSYSQVIEPVHGRSIGRWRRYAGRFAGVLPVLQPWLQRWGYDAGRANDGR